MFKTSVEEIEEIARKELFRAEAYRPIPGYKIDPKTGEKIWNSNLTIGYGQENALFPGTPGEIKVIEGLVIDEKTAKAALYFFVYNIVDPLVRFHCNPQTQNEHDACASWVYNIQHQKLPQYNLPKLISRADRSPEAVQEIIDKWLEYCLTTGAESGLFRRRLIELLKFLGLPHDDKSVLGLINTARVANCVRGEHLRNPAYIHPTGKFEATVNPDFVFDMAESIYEQLDENAQTAALNNKQAKALGGKPVEYVPPDTPLQKPKVKAKPVETPALPPEPEAVPMEKSGTHKNLSNADTGKEIVATGAVTTTVLAGTMPWMNQISAFIQKTDMMTIYKTAGVLLAIFMIIGGVRWWWGRMGAYRERQQTTRVKV